MPFLLVCLFTNSGIWFTFNQEFPLFEQKLKLKSECEKEIKEVVAQINRKYKLVKLQEKKTIYVLEKELVINFNKVLLNKGLDRGF